MTVVVVILAIVVVLLAVLVAGLLRSHAEILRQLHDLGAGMGGGATAPGPDPGVPATEVNRPRTDGRVPAPASGVPDGRRAVDIVGTGPRGESLAIRTIEVEHDTVLVFLSTGCTTCSTFWSDLQDPELPAGTRLVIVTRNPDEELPATVLDLAPAGSTVAMSTQAWDDLRVPGSPFVVHVHGPSGRVIGEGTAASWDQVLELFLRAGGDQRLGGGKASADARRERELDRVLLEAGIAPGDPSLYPATEDGGTDPADRSGG